MEEAAGGHVARVGGEAAWGWPPRKDCADSADEKLCPKAKPLDDF